ncbi:TPA: hydrogenase maturation nickel metallochaperone HypA, partial [Klebsiella pneumoniae]
QHAGCCPHCGSERLRISEGDDLRVKSLEGE